MFIIQLKRRLLAATQDYCPREGDTSQGQIRQRNNGQMLRTAVQPISQKAHPRAGIWQAVREAASCYLIDASAS